MIFEFLEIKNVILEFFLKSKENDFQFFTELNKLFLIDFFK